MERFVMSERAQVGLPPNPIADLNDRLRVTGQGGRILVTRGVTALPEEEIAAILAAVRAFNRFDAGNDPYGEHDCAVIEAAGRRVLWKIDPYDLAMTGYSPAPADPSVTRRVLTIMLADEY